MVSDSADSAGSARTLPTTFLVVLVALLAAETTVNYIDRQVLSVLAPVLRDEFRLTNAEYAAILNAFMITYMLSCGLAGWVISTGAVGTALMGRVEPVRLRER
jgi:ACS family hexuronate transporter-like MFS transporter